MLLLDSVKHSYDNILIQFPDFEARPGEHWLVLGRSGCGKSTLLHILAGVLRAKQGSVTINEQNLSNLKGAALDRFRGRNIGLVFQQMHLLPTLTVSENLLVAQYMAGIKQDKARVNEVLKSLDILEKQKAYPEELSVGQRQRVAIGRAVVNKPRIILADEPTSSLDDINCQHVMDLLISQAKANNAVLVIATHDQRIKSRFNNQINLDENLN